MVAERAEVETTGESARTGDDRNNNIIAPSNVPDMLPTMSVQDIWSKEVTVTPREVVPQIEVQKTEVERIEEGSNEESGEEQKRSWKRSRVEMETRKGVVRDMFRMPSDDDEEDASVIKKDDRRASCPIFGCDWKTQKLRNHVNRMHLPRVMWDNPNPPVKQNKYHNLNNIRGKVLLFLTQKIVGSKSVLKRVESLIPKKAVLLGRQIEQMRSLTTTMRWQRPVYNRYTLYPPNHTSVLIHWRYQVALLKHLDGPDIDTYLNFGLDFMIDPDNLEVPSRRERKTLMARSLLNVQAPQPEWDEAKAEDDSGVITMDVCGEPDELEASGSIEEEVIQRKVTIGSQNYTLVLRGTTLDISGGVHRRSPSPEETTESEDHRSIREVCDAFDTHFHLDRSSKRLLGNLSLTMETWTDESMERPSKVPVNLIGGTLIYCDPESFPTSVPIDDTWRVAVGLHPKKVHGLRAQHYQQFLSLVQSRRVVAVGEIGLDRTVSEKYWAEQLEFLETITSTLKNAGKPIILHVRSTRQDKFSSLLYMLLLQFLSDKFATNQVFILHCFTGSFEIPKAWLTQFPNTYFGFTFLASSFAQTQINALKSVPRDRLLVETDAPYIAPSGIRINSPVYLGEVLEVVARHRHERLEDVCRQTCINAFAVFGQ